MDAKGRISLPNRFREALMVASELPLVLTTNHDPESECLLAYPQSEWRQLAGQLQEASRFDPNVIRFRRLILGTAVECALDKQARLLVPPVLREHAGLNRDVLWVGTGQYLEIWDKGRFAEEQKRIRGSFPEIHTALRGRGL